MEVILSKRHLSPTRCQPSKRGRPLPWASHSEDSPIFTLEDGKKFHIIEEDVEDTTLLKAVPYNRIRRYDWKELNDLIEQLSKENVFLQNGKEHRLFSDDDFEILDLIGVGDDIWPSRTGPVLQVIYVSISNETHPKGFEIYGEISMTDYKRDTCYIYKCEPEEPDYVKEVNSECHLYLTPCPIVPAMGGKVKFSLTIKDSKVQIFDKECDVKDAIEDTEKGTFTLDCKGTGGYLAKMVFTKIPFAVIAKAEMFLRYTPPRPGENETSFEVHGEITANQVIVTKHEEREEMEHGIHNLIIPYRYVFAASLFSSLVVKVKLYTGNLELADNTYTVTTCSGSLAEPRSSLFECKDKYCFFEMDVDWIPHDDFFRHSDLQWLSYASDPVVGPPGPSMREMCQLVTPDPVEVFSVSIGGVSAPRGIHGTIVVRDDGGKVYIFARNADCPDKLSSSNEQFRTVSLAWPDRWVLEKDLFMHLNLRDVQDDQVCRGHLSWCTGRDGRYDRRLCDVIRSDVGWFAAVHYSVFKNGKKATVSVKCIDGGPYILYGSVFAQYDNHDYPSPYDKQCYRSTIFRRSEEECLIVENDSEVQLSKSHVSAPSDCKQLIVVADLWAVHLYTASCKHATGKLPFEAERDAIQSEALGGCFEVTVNWS